MAAPNGILLATKNAHKVEEIRSILAGEAVVLRSLLDFPEVGEAVEDGSTYEENARKKALYYASETGCPALADDSGLEIDFLNGEPGIISARYISPDISFRERNEIILERLKDVDDQARKAHFTCVVAVVTGDMQVRLFRSELHGFIARKMMGANGFGYDPIFYVPEYDKNLAELSPEIKNSISHRAGALRKACEALKSLMVP